MAGGGGIQAVCGCVKEGEGELFSDGLHTFSLSLPSIQMKKTVERDKIKWNKKNGVMNKKNIRKKK